MKRIFFIFFLFMLFVIFCDKGLLLARSGVGGGFSHNTMAYSLIKEKKYKDAIEFLGGVSKDKYNYFTYYVLGEAHRYMGEYKEALVFYRLSISMFDDEVVVKDKAIIHSGLAYVYSRLGKYDLAIVGYLKSLIYIPNNYIILSNVGRSYLKLGDYDNALKYFNKALELNPSYLVALRGLARVYFELGSFKSSIFFYNKLREISPNMPDAYFGLAYNLDKLGNKELSSKAFSKAYFLSGDYEKSLEHIKKFSYRDDKSDYILLISAYIYLKRYKLAEVEINKAIDMYKGEEDFVFIKSQLYFIKKDYKRSVLEALSGIKVFSGSHRLHALLGRAYLKLSDNENAILYYEKALWLKQDDVGTRERLAHIYRKAGKHDLEFFHQGVVYFFLGDYVQSGKVLAWINAKVFGDRSALIYYKGMVLWASGKKQEAISYFISSMEEDDSFYLSYLALARGYDELGEHDKSIKLLEKYIGKYPKSYHIGKVKELHTLLSSSGGGG